MKIKKTKEDNFLLFVPKKKHNDWEMKDGKVFLIFHHDKTIEKFIRWLVKKPYISDIELDEIGSAVWEIIDGKNSVYEISNKLVERFGDKCHPIYDRLIMYLRYLNRRGLIAFDRFDG